MHLAVACPHFYKRGGIERVAISAVNGLHRLGFTVTAAGSYVEPGALDEGVRWGDVDKSRWGGAGVVAQFGKTATRVLEAEDKPEGVLGFGVVCPDDAVTWVQSVHARWLETSRTQQFRGRLKRKLNPFHRVAIGREKQLFGGRRYRRLLALTRDVAADLEHFYAVPSGDIEVVSNGVCPDEFHTVDDRVKLALRAEFGLQPDRPTISFVANESDRKGLPQLIESVSRMTDRRVQLLLAGRIGGACKQLAEQYGIADRVYWVGQREQIAPIFQASDLFVLPTRYEAWGLVIVEALACGVPVITTRDAGAACAVRESVNGYLLDDASDVEALTAQLQRALNDTAWNRQAIAESATPYQWQSIMSRVGGIMQSVYADRPWQGSGRSAGLRPKP